MSGWGSGSSLDAIHYANTLIAKPVVAGSNRICGMRVAYYAPSFFANGFE